MPGKTVLRARFRLATKLAVALVISTGGLFLLFGWINLHVQQDHFEQMVVLSAERASDIIQRSTRYQMLRNDREALYHVITTIGSEPGIRRIRIFNEDGRISFSTDPQEVGNYVDKRAEACYACHSPEERLGQPLARLPRTDRARIFTDAQGRRTLGVIRPIENEPACSNAACHAHPPDRRILGVIDADLSLDSVDAQLAAQQKQLGAFTLGALLLVSLVSVGFVWVVVHRPIRELTSGTRRVAEGHLDLQLPVRSGDELGLLAESFNKMTHDLASARAELTEWARTLEDRVESKARELKQAHEHVVQVEKMASIGKLAAVVAHEINNPLAGILTYAKLLRKWLESGPWDAARTAEARSSLELIEAESRRCGEIVKNLLTLSRAGPMRIEPVHLAAVVDRVVRLVRHQLELGTIHLTLDLEDPLPAVRGDPAALEQLLLALVLNAIDAMPRGGNLWLHARRSPGGTEIELKVRDDGPGIPADALPHLFEPFFTTKDRGRGVGLGLAISKAIVERHHGGIQVESEPGRGTAFTVTFPADQESHAPVSSNSELVKAR